MANFKKTIATARAKVAEADAKAYQARFEAIEAILQGAAPRDVMICARTPSRQWRRIAARHTRTSSKRSCCGCWAIAWPSRRNRTRPRLTGTATRPRTCTEAAA